MKPKHFDNEEASAGGLAGLVTLFLMFGFFTFCLGFGVDVIVTTGNDLAGQGFLNQDALNTIKILAIIFGDLPIIYLLMIGLDHIFTAKRDTTGEV